MSNDRHELDEIAESSLDDFPHNCEIDGLVPVDQDVPETDHVPEAPRKLAWKPTASFEEIDELPVRPWFAEMFVGNDVGGDIQQRLNRNLQGMFHKPLLADVGGNACGLAQRTKLLDAGFDLRQFLGDQIGIGHGRPAGIRSLR